MRWTIISKRDVKIAFLLGKVNEVRIRDLVLTLHRHGADAWIVHREKGEFHVYAASWPVVRARWNALLIELRK